MEKPIKSLVVHDLSKTYQTFNQQMIDDFLFQILTQKIKPNGICLQNIDDVIFLRMAKMKPHFKCFDLSNTYYKNLILNGLKESAFFDAPKDSRYPAYYPEYDNTIYLSFQIRLKYNTLFDKGMSKEEYLQNIHNIMPLI